MLTKEQLIEKLKENQHLFSQECISIAQDRFFIDNKVRYGLFMYRCDKQELYLNVTLNDSSRWWQNGKSSSDDVFIDGFSLVTEEYEGGFENCRFNLSELLG